MKSSVPVPGVGVCQNDLNFLARMVLDVLQVNLKAPLTEETIREHAMAQVASDLGTICDRMVDSSEPASSFENILRRLQAVLVCAGECAETLSTLAALPSMATESCVAASERKAAE